VRLAYQSTLENMRAWMYSALGITEQRFRSGDACRVQWTNHTDRGVPKGGTTKAPRGR
jgi:hypothetical protein